MINNMPNYQLSKIYKVTNDLNNEIYIGSTAKKRLSERMSNHRSVAKLGLDLCRGKGIHPSNCKLHIMMNELGAPHFKIVLIENFPCSSKDELASKEDDYIRILKPTLNLRNAVFNDEKLKISEKQKHVKIHCEACDKMISKHHIRKHERTQNHLDNL